MDVLVCIPLHNPGVARARRMVAALAAQTVAPRVLVIDSASRDGSAQVFADFGAEVVPAGEFDHGCTRNLALSRRADAYVYLTHDAFPRPDAIERLSAALAREGTGVAFGRQVAGPGAPPAVTAHRAFNYPAESYRRTAADVASMGVRAAFNSNAFAAYHPDALRDVGGFPCPIVHSEDRYVAARMLAAGWAVAYEAGAVVEHFHLDSVVDDFRRYFDIGAFQAADPWFEEYLGGAGAEGARLVRAQLAAVRAARVPLGRARVLARAGVRLAGYRSGRWATHLPSTVAARLSSNPGYWRRSNR